MKRRSENDFAGQIWIARKEQSLKIRSKGDYINLQYWNNITKYIKHILHSNATEKEIKKELIFRISRESLRCDISSRITHFVMNTRAPN